MFEVIVLLILIINYLMISIILIIMKVKIIFEAGIFFIFHNFFEYRMNRNDGRMGKLPIDSIPFMTPNTLLIGNFQFVSLKCLL